MDLQIITTFCIVDEFLKSITYKDDQQAQMSNAEIITLALIAMKFFAGNFENARQFFLSHNYFKKVLSKSRLNRRIQKIPDYVWQLLLKIFHKGSLEKEFIVDSFPIPTIKNIRISRSKKYTGKQYRAYNASKKEYFYGLKIHMLTSIKGRPLEFSIKPSSIHDIKAFKSFTLNLQSNSTIYADAGYNDYKFEEELLQSKKITLAVKRRSNAKKAPLISLGKSFRKRKRIETTFSSILDMTTRTIRAITPKGFELKLTLFICAYTFFNFG